MTWYERLDQTGAPSIEPITSAEAKGYARIDSSDEDTLVDSLIKRSRIMCEAWTERQIITATWTLKMPFFPAYRIMLPKPPLQSITSIQYYDTNGDSQTISAANYQVNTSGTFRGSVVPVSSYSWPAVESGKENAVTLTFVAGYGDATTDVPESLRVGLMDLFTYLYENRGVEGRLEMPNMAELFGSEFAQTV